MSLMELDEMINVDGGCFLYFDKLPPPEDEDPKKAKGAPAKGKVPVEEMKPLYGKAWVDFGTLQNPGANFI